MSPEFADRFAFSAAWVLAWAGASLVYRALKGHPIVYRRLPRVRFREWNATGNSHRNWFTRLGGANGFLVVQVTDDVLDIHPFVPFNWLFLPEILGIEHRVPLSGVASARPVPVERAFTHTVFRKFVKRRGVEVELVSGEGAREKVSLWLKEPEGFLSALGMPPAPRAAKPSPGRFSRGTR
jgi:hypothetical protein